MSGNVGLSKVNPQMMIGCLLLALVIWKIANANWPVTSFQVIAREPTGQELLKPQDSVADSIASQLGFGGPEQNTPAAETEIPEAAQWLQEMSQRYSMTGHRSPALEPVLDIAGQKRIRAYMFPFTGSRTRDGMTSDATYEANTCKASGKIPWLAVNQNGAIDNLPRMTYHAFAHEMMHAIEYGSRLTDQCTHDPFWITEGMANGAAAMLMNRKYPREISHRDRSASAVGLRSYRIPLTHTSGQQEKTLLDLKMGYGTSSLWQFLAERFGGLNVYPHFLDKVMTREMDSAEQMRWFEERLQSLEGLSSRVSASPQRTRGKAKQPPGFYEVFPAFLAEFASYGGSRYMAFGGRRHSIAEVARDHWLERAFGGCQTIELSPDSMYGEIPFSVFKNAAICLRLKYQDFSGNVSTKMEIISPNLLEMDSFHLGWAWKIGPNETKSCYGEREKLKSKWPPCVYKTFTSTFPPSKAYARSWPEEKIDFGSGSGKTVEHILILTNAAVQPWRSKNTQKLTLKVAVSKSTLNNKPAEPIEKMAVPRKRSKTPNPAKPIGKEELYGLETDPPQAVDPVKGLRLGPYTPNRVKGATALPGGYAAVFYEMEYGKTGPLTGIIKREPGESGMASLVSSGLCADSTRPIGEILQSDEMALRIRLNADLCEAQSGSLQQCEGGCPVVDHVQGEVDIAFGWRQFGATAPTDIRTAGIERYIQTMPDSLEEALNFGAGTALPGDDESPVQEGTNEPGASEAGVLAPCACTCEEYKATETEANVMRARIDAGGEATMADLRRLNRCQATCQNEYLLCVFQSDRAAQEKRKREQLEAEKQAASDCDCSCKGIDQVLARGRELEAQFAGGGQVPMDELATLARCSEACQQEMLSCAMRQ
jgi:hypothetical protein